MQNKNTLRRLKDLGLSPWYDFIQRRLITGGILKRLFDSGILGVTSNPAIFEKAIDSSSEYDNDILDLSKKGLDAMRIYDELAALDIGMTCDLLRSVYEKSVFFDGYVSIEVLPEYAHNPSKTIDYGRYIYKKINRPNIMIKIPGTEESYEAISVLVREGLNVNVTLLFSALHYQRSADAYIDGLKKRFNDNKPLNIVCSVSSVFVSRIDTMVDKMLDEAANNTNRRAQVASLKGKVATANSKLIYKRFKEIFYSDEFRVLMEHGAHVQRPLWASTGTKNPDYSDVKYVEDLIAKDCVNTMPHATLDAYLDHGNPRITIENDFSDSEDCIKKLSNFGIDINSVCQKLQDEGVDLFSVSFNKLIQSIRNKSVAINPHPEVLRR